MNKIIYNVNYLQNYCEQNQIILIKNYEKTNRDTKIEGKCLSLNCSYNFDKVFRQLVKTGGYCNNCSKIKHQNNILKSVQNKYGVDNVFQLTNIKEKIIKKNIKKY